MSSECPTCGESFKNEHGVRAHHSQKHGGPGIEVSKVVVECDYCESKVEKYPSVAKESDLHFCDNECQRKWKSECKPKEEHNWYKGGPVEVECSNCKEVIERKSCIVEQNKRFYCSNECEAEWKSDNQIPYRWGDNKTNYSGRYYGSNWQRQRKKRLDVDNYECVICGMSDAEHKREEGRSLSVHHVMGIDKFRDEETNDIDEEKANDLTNLITMCRSCHRKWEGIPLVPENRAISDLTSAGALAVSELSGDSE